VSRFVQQEQQPFLKKEGAFNSSLLSFTCSKEFVSLGVLAASCKNAGYVDEPLDVDIFFKSQSAEKVKFKQVLIMRTILFNCYIRRKKSIFRRKT
jgi:hypothetical protein